MRILLLQPGCTPLDLFKSPSEHQVERVGGGERLSWSGFSALQRSLRSNPPDIVLVTDREKSFLPPGVGWIRGAGSCWRAFMKNPQDFFIFTLFARAVRQGLPIAMVNRSDDGRLLPGSDWFYRRCHACFVRELHPLPEIALRDLFTPSGGNPQSNRRARRITSWFDPTCPSRRDISKLRPISLGVPDGMAGSRLGRADKSWDIFFAGDLHEKGFRGRLVAELQALAGGTGWKILLRDRLPHGEYVECLAASRLCLSPPGMGWDCWRHYEAMLTGSVPVMPYPTILSYQPPQDGRHCFYFAPEPGGLTRCLEKVMAQTDRLPAMAAAGRNLVLENHTYAKLREYVIRETLEAFARFPTSRPQSTDY